MTASADGLALLDLHFESFYAVEPFATKTGHPVPMDTRGWSQVLASTLCGIRGLERQKGPDLADGSDVKGANTWEAIDTPRFNGVIKAGTHSTSAGKLESLDGMPNLYLVLWDQTMRSTWRCRIWTVRTQVDPLFRQLCREWYGLRAQGQIVSNNFQLHPPRGLDSNVIRNSCGNLSYPLYFCAERGGVAEKYALETFDESTRVAGACSPA